MYGCIAVRVVMSFFFFSSRRRHTRFDCDWSSDVCSSDLAALEQSGERLLACQFHPELSGAYGAALLERWLAGAKGAPAPALAGSTPGLLPRVVPCLDVRDGRVVKGVQFQHLRDAGDPASQAALYESQSADEIVVLDVAASAEGRATQLETVGRGRPGARIPPTRGGGGPGGEA